MFDQLGLSFLPSADANGDRNEAGPGSGRLEDVLRILSFRFPKVLGAKAIAAPELLNSPGGSALPAGGGVDGDPIANAIVQQVLQNMPNAGGVGAASPAGSFAPAMPGGGTSSSPMSPMSPPKPRIIPIEDQPASPGSGGASGEFGGALDSIDQQLRRGRHMRQY